MGDRRQGQTAREPGQSGVRWSRCASARRRAKRRIQSPISTAGRDEQPQVVRLREGDLIEFDPGKHRS